MTKKNEPLTKKDLQDMEARIKEQLKEKASKDDLKGFATKDDFKNLKDEMVGLKDEIVGEVKALREEFETHAFSHERFGDEIDDHEKRISNLEKRPIL